MSDIDRPGGSTLKPVDGADASGDTNIDLGTMTSEFSHYEVYISGGVPATDSVDARLELSPDGGATTPSGYEYEYVWQAGSNQSTGEVDGLSELTLTEGSNNALGNSGGEQYSAKVSIHSPADPNLVTVMMVTGVLYNGRNIRHTLTCTYTNAEAIDTVRLSLAGSDWQSGRFDLYGVTEK
jgi:hypothetical protein